MQEIGPLPDAGGELAITPTEPLTPARPSAQNRKWTAAIVISCLLHAAVAAVFLISPSGTFDFEDGAQAEGSDRSGADVTGSALDHKTPAVKVALVPSPPPAKPQAARTEAAKPVPPVEPPQPATQATAQAPKPSPEAVKQPTVTPDILVADAPRPDDRSVNRKTEIPAQPVVPPESTETTAVFTGQPPIPSPRPSPAAAPASETNEKRGTADGQEQFAQAASKGKKQNEAGIAAEASYRGDVLRKLSRVNRAVPPSVQGTARKNTVVTLVIGSKGNIDELRILESSGSAAFDQAVLGFVRKAAPFPPIPPQAASKSMLFEGAIGPF
ncbi:TonB family protein [Mesorhizobium sp. M9A.F.Ca.ET.002.03.1.2]|nr:TonB family protein [Mesorhizobium sp. M9A.F.Ca.ET.002.03.1.2]AZO01541.1 TonB family protein [Mesorhizobium sp. M9A.F.Ca.ET.002.03.1.2]